MKQYLINPIGHNNAALSYCTDILQLMRLCFTGQRYYSRDDSYSVHRSLIIEDRFTKQTSVRECRDARPLQQLSRCSCSAGHGLHDPSRCVSGGIKRKTGIKSEA